MAHHLDNLCFDMVDGIQKESDIITEQIDTFYKENKDKKLTENKFQEQIVEFKIKYAYSLAGLVNTTTNEVIAINTECSEKLKGVVDNLVNYISNLD